MLFIDVRRYVKCLAIGSLLFAATASAQEREQEPLFPPQDEARAQPSSFRAREPRRWNVSFLYGATTFYDSDAHRTFGASFRIRLSDRLSVEPEFRYISTMHGDEWLGNEMCLYLIDHLTDNYGSDPDITEMVDEIDIWIMPLMNPDGYVSGSRYNANFVDLNRNFPDPYTSPDNTTDGREPETAVIMNWSFASSFSLSANFHAGA